ncbi:hypothetical protein ACPA54_18810 [Uniformispora flossi]|uniref:hypothetical protein n=1 Tax=Uniformispora flossi TaxID=3390723 RepID=UPI003C2DE545
MVVVIGAVVSAVAFVGVKGCTQGDGAPRASSGASAGTQVLRCIDAVADGLEMLRARTFETGTRHEQAEARYRQMMGDGWADTAYGRITLDVYETARAAKADDGETAEDALRRECAAEFG